MPDSEDKGGEVSDNHHEDCALGNNCIQWVSHLVAHRAGRYVHIFFLGLNVVVKYFGRNVYELQQQPLGVRNLAFLDLKELVGGYHIQFLVLKDRTVLEHGLDLGEVGAIKKISAFVGEHEYHLAQLMLRQR